MDDILTTSVLKRIIEIDASTDQTIEQLQVEIKDREKKLKDIRRNIENNSNLLQAEQGKKLYDLILSEANKEKDEKEAECKSKLESMDQLYESGKEALIKAAINKLNLER
ncbi:MAG: hypothetical protein BGO41_10275 [Clostridiales bacterium 38-18]|nr:MAG: hypothetical protein BGO41_10275 [Clostridiales bacterium 38-18]